MVKAAMSKYLKNYFYFWGFYFLRMLLFHNFITNLASAKNNYTCCIVLCYTVWQNIEWNSLSHFGREQWKQITLKFNKQVGVGLKIFFCFSRVHLPSEQRANGGGILDDANGELQMEEVFYIFNSLHVGYCFKNVTWGQLTCEIILEYWYWKKVIFKFCIKLWWPPCSIRYKKFW